MKTQREVTTISEFNTSKECEKYLIQEKKFNDAAVKAFLISVGEYVPVRGGRNYQEESKRHAALLKNNGFDLHIEIQAQ